MYIGVNFGKNNIRQYNQQMAFSCTKVSTSEPAFAEAAGQPSVLTGNMQVTSFRKHPIAHDFVEE